MKTCSTCGVAKPSNQFYGSRVSADGLQGRCRECILAYDRQYQMINRKRLSAYHTAYRNNTPEYRRKESDRKRRKGKADE